ncbi:MAG TPA: ATP synthase F1 subunit delta [Candidatus Limnocylindria bacterium]|nr:ATP synthase F1 subunit delta [Candidatus Limnocylindria bacterium]
MALGGSAARRYAEALLEFAVEEKAVPAYRSSLEALASGLDAHALRALREPRVPLERRLAAVSGIAKGEPHALGALLAILVRRDRIALLPGIAAAFGELVDEREGIANARVTTAVELGPKDRDGVVGRLERATGKKIRATFSVDQALLGGARVQLGDRLVDGSVRTQLENLRAQLAR